MTAHLTVHRTGPHEELLARSVLSAGEVPHVHPAPLLPEDGAFEMFLAPVCWCDFLQLLCLLSIC